MRSSNNEKDTTTITKQIQRQRLQDRVREERMTQVRNGFMSREEYHLSTAADSMRYREQYKDRCGAAYKVGRSDNSESLSYGIRSKDQSSTKGNNSGPRKL